MKGNITTKAQVQTHPDYQKFFKLGSPFNFLSRDPETKSFFEKEEVLIHYSQSQTAFAHHSMNALIELDDVFKPAEIFDLTSENISENEIQNVEKFYEQVTRSRVLINEKTAGSFAKFNELRRLRMGEDIGYSEYSESLNLLSYCPSSEQIGTATTLSASGKYSKYSQALQDQFGKLILSYFVKILEAKPDPQDNKIRLGTIEIVEEDEVLHRMGTYRNRNMLSNDFQMAELDDPSRRIKRVDEITALALKKVFTTKDEDEALKCAFIFGALRGYNVRSAAGACWGQEITMRKVFEEKGWPQFCKMPGIYLDIEAVMLGKNNPQEQLEKLMQRQVEDYKNSVVPKSVVVQDSLFDEPVRQKSSDFVRYLIETRKYRAEDLPEIIAYKGNSEEDKTALHIAARNGDGKLFEMLGEALKSDSALKKNVESMRGVEWDEVVKNAKRYGDLEAVKKVKECGEAISFESQSSRNSSFLGKLFLGVRSVFFQVTLSLLPNNFLLKNLLHSAESTRLKNGSYEGVVSDSNFVTENSSPVAVKADGVRVVEVASLKGVVQKGVVSSQSFLQR